MGKKYVAGMVFSGEEGAYCAYGGLDNAQYHWTDPDGVEHPDAAQLILSHRMRHFVGDKILVTIEAYKDDDGET